MYSLLVTNIPYDWHVRDFQNWLERQGVAIRRLKLIQDLVSGTSPSFAEVELVNSADAQIVARRLDGQRLRNHILRVKAEKLIDTSKPLYNVKATA